MHVKSGYTYHPCLNTKKKDTETLFGENNLRLLYELSIIID